MSPNDRLAFAEVCRVLKPGGRFLFTVPLADAALTVERAVRSEAGEVMHLLPPKHHGDPVRGGAAVLAYRDYGRHGQVSL